MLEPTVSLAQQGFLDLQLTAVAGEMALSLAELVIHLPLAAAVQVAVAPIRAAQAARVES